MTSRWTHLMCADCWRRENPDRAPTQVIMVNPVIQSCCFCGGGTTDYIYVRESPKTAGCQGRTGIHRQEERE